MRKINYSAYTRINNLKIININKVMDYCIDLGSFKTVVTYNNGSVSDVVVDGMSQRSTPSVVAFKGN